MKFWYRRALDLYGNFMKCLSVYYTYNSGHDKRKQGNRLIFTITGEKSGAQKGHKGCRLSKSSIQEKLDNGKYSIPEEYRNELVYVPSIKALAVDLYSEGVMSNDRIASFMNSAGNFQSWQNQK